MSPPAAVARTMRAAASLTRHRHSRVLLGRYVGRSGGAARSGAAGALRVWGAGAGLRGWSTTP
jgi:hypothetical protein